jgi:hypothetical protein
MARHTLHINVWHVAHERSEGTFSCDVSHIVIDVQDTVQHDFRVTMTCHIDVQRASGVSRTCRTARSSVAHHSRKQFRAFLSDPSHVIVFE